MNPEEGELRPQLLDRFGLMVDVEGISDPQQRMLILQRRIEFESDPQAFYDRWRESEELLSRQIAEARERLPNVTYTTENLYSIARLTAELGVDGHRADITILKAAIANAAFEGRTRVTEVDILTAAELALPHRLKRRPLQDTARDLEALHERLQQAREEAARREAEQEQSGDDGDATGEKKTQMTAR